MNDISQAGSSGVAARKSHRAKLTTEQKEYVVRRLAAYDRLSDIVRGLRDQFGVVVTRQAVVLYDPTRFAACPRRWKQLFFEARQAITGNMPNERAEETRSQRRERLMLNAVEVLADRILVSMADAGSGSLAKAPEQVTDDDRISALATFVDRLKATNPDGYARIQAALKDKRSEGSDV